MGGDVGVFIIAEAGVNHNGSCDQAKRLIDVAVEARADAVKFQIFRAEHLVTRSAPKADYQTGTTGNIESQFEMIRKLELSNSDFEALIHYANAKGIAFLSTPFDVESLDFLIRKAGVRTIKISSGDISNAPLLLEISRSAENVILSTGMASLGDVEAALGVLAFGFSRRSDWPRPEAFANAFASDEGQKELRKRVTLLHCTTEYPAPFDEINLKAMDTLAAAFALPVGYSDHTKGIHISLAAVARGACVIEKHYTLDRGLSGPDHMASLEPDELKQLVLCARDIERSLGDGCKRPSPSESKNRSVARRSLVAARDIALGEVLGPDNVACKRPGTGMSPFNLWSVSGCRAKRGYREGDLLDE